MRISSTKRSEGCSLHSGTREQTTSREPSTDTQCAKKRERLRNHDRSRFMFSAWLLAITENTASHRFDVV